MCRTIVVLCDGTGKQFGRDNTNVVHAYRRLLGRSADQIVLYDPGIGTFAPAWLERRVGDAVGQGLSKAFGYGLRENLEDTYRFLMAHFEEGDRVILLGFSRGAFTVRCLAGLLTKCGLLWPHEDNLVPYAIRHYFASWRDDGRTARRQAVIDGFRETFTRPCAPHVVAVWDTVNAYGLFTGARFPNATLHPDIPFGFQALALDEVRANFQPSPWNPPQGKQVIEQVWFAGAHSDVGGGYPDRALSDIALKWLLERAGGQGLQLHPDWRDGVTGNPLAPMHDETRKLRWKLANLLCALVGRSGQRTVPPDAVFHASVRVRLAADPGYRPARRGIDPVGPGWR